MSKITASLVKSLREKTGAGMMDCKKALSANEGSLEAATDWLREKGLSAAAKKSGRVASEGLVSVVIDNNCGAIIEVNSETDFVSRNNTFQDFVETVSRMALTVDGDIDRLRLEQFPGSDRNLTDEIVQMIATIGENLMLRRSSCVKVGNGVVSSYIHTAVKAGQGKIGVLVGLESEGDKARLSEVGKSIAMHIAAANPICLAVNDVNADTLERERKILVAQAKDSGKADAVIEKMVEGRLKKFYEESVLLEQVFVVSEEKIKISKVLENLSSEIGSPVAISGFIRFGLGDGIQKEEKDFASEVADAVAS